MKYLFPVKEPYSISQYFGGNHLGIDIVSEWNTPIYPIAEAVVIDARDYVVETARVGKYVRYICKNPYQDGFLEIINGHCSEVLCKNGDVVTPNDIIAKVGNTGEVTSNGVIIPIDKQGISPYLGTHDHFASRKRIEAYVGWELAEFPGFPKTAVADYTPNKKGYFNPLILFPELLRAGWKSTMAFALFALMGVKLTDEMRGKIIQLLNN